MDNQQGLELLNAMCQLGWERENGYMYMYPYTYVYTIIWINVHESLRCLPETATTWLIYYIPIQNKSFKFGGKKRIHMYT